MIKNFAYKYIYLVYILNNFLIHFCPKIASLEQQSNLPEEFDLRKEYKECKSLNHIRNQENCGGCWAFAVAEVISDRICIKSKGKEQPIISENELITCCDDCYENNTKKGCGGGNPAKAFKYWQNTGLPIESCKPFHKFEEYNESNLNCSTKCEDGSAPIKRYKGSDYRWIENNTYKIMNEIYVNGSVTALFEIYGDDFRNFWHYKRKSEIYSLTPGYELKNLSYHAIKIIGWGSEIINGKKEKYWLCVNSWGTDQNNDGFFKFKRGENHLDIERWVCTGYYDSEIISSNQESIIVYEDNFFNFKNLDEDFM